LFSHSLLVIYIYIHCQELNLLEFSLNSFNKICDGFNNRQFVLI
jgi:hypothetical protein